ncbi:MAG TPA: hypothetical protein VMG81_03470 [Thermoplasmata archaeon]|nr:hypothetical protein [Thermoplasmata archaeon]
MLLDHTVQDYIVIAGTALAIGLVSILMDVIGMFKEGQFGLSGVVLVFDGIGLGLTAYSVWG